MRTKLDWALHWAARGFAVFPCLPGRKAPATSNGFKAGTTDEVTIRAWWREEPDYNPAIWTKGFTVLDVDVKNGKPGLSSLFDLEIDEDTLRVVSPSKGPHLYYMGSTPRSTAGTALGKGIDTRSDNGYVLAGGAYLDEREPTLVGSPGAYSVICDRDPIALPEKVETLLRASTGKKELSHSVEMDTPANIAAAINYLEQCPITGTYAVAGGVKDYGVSPAMAVELMMEHWNPRRDEMRDEEHIATRVNNAFTTGQNSPGILSPEAEFGGISIEPPEKAERTPSRLIWAGDPLGVDDDEWLVYEKFPAKGVGMVVAPSQAGKTFFALKLAECLATGEPFFGTTPDEKVGTLFLAAEGIAGLPKRMAAFANLPFAALPISGLDTVEAVKSMQADAAMAAAEMKARFGVRLGLIVIETLSASLLVKDENDNSEMARAMKNLEQLAKSFGCLVLFTHHTPKSTTGARGAGASFNGVDVVVEIFREGERPVRQVRCTKGREGPTDRWGSFTLDVVVLGVDRKLRDITTCTLSMGDEAAVAHDTRPPANVEAFMTAFDNARANGGLAKGSPVPREELRFAFKELCPQVKDVTNPFKRCLAWAEARFAVTVSDVAGETYINDQRPAIGDV